MKKTPWGRMDMSANEFYFKPKFSLNFLPYAEDGLFIEKELEVMFKFDPYRNQWRMRGIWDDEGRVFVDEKTSNGIRRQGLIRINAAIDYIFSEDSAEESKDNV